MTSGGLADADDEGCAEQKLWLGQALKAVVGAAVAWRVDIIDTGKDTCDIIRKDICAEVQKCVQACADMRAHMQACMLEERQVDQGHR